MGQRTSRKRGQSLKTIEDSAERRPAKAVWRESHRDEFRHSTLAEVKRGNLCAEKDQADSGKKSGPLNILGGNVQESRKG